MSTLWHGRFAEGPSDELMAFTVSLPFDRRLARDDIAGSRAHARMLRKVGLLSAAELAAILDGLDLVEAEIVEGRFEYQPSDEDIHTAVERRLTDLAGAPGAKLHTGRSRNDQVATDLRLWTKRSLAEVGAQIVEFQRVLLERAREAGETYLPGYTHLQRAQPVLLAHHLLAHGWALSRDFERLLDCRGRVDVSPLGAGALAGSSLPLEPAETARELGFASVFENSLDAVGDRDFVAESLFCLAMVAVHLSRLAEDVILWSTDEWGFLSLDDRWSTGSSMMPQKKNPDIAELARGKAGRLIGHLTGILAVLKALPLAYNRDLQEDKEPLFDAFDQIRLVLPALGGLIATARFERERMEAAADSPYLAATDLAEWLVSRGKPFREAHALIGGLVRDSLARKVSLVELVAAHPELGEAAAALMAPGVAVGRRSSPGASG
ncbi:MAG: argininosuccinate lyase, partial [Acidimicrobiia bacterium]|nr:argininosuccinate lyase [Acidimicrobiia bacterium]